VWDERETWEEGQLYSKNYLRWERNLGKRNLGRGITSNYRVRIIWDEREICKRDKGNYRLGVGWERSVRG